MSPSACGGGSRGWWLEEGRDVDHVAIAIGEDREQAIIGSWLREVATGEGAEGWEDELAIGLNPEAIAPSALTACAGEGDDGMQVAGDDGVLGARGGRGELRGAQGFVPKVEAGEKMIVADAGDGKICWGIATGVIVVASHQEDGDEIALRIDEGVPPGVQQGHGEIIAATASVEEIAHDGDVPCVVTLGESREAGQIALDDLAGEGSVERDALAGEGCGLAEVDVGDQEGGAGEVKRGAIGEEGEGFTCDGD